MFDLEARQETVYAEVCSIVVSVLDGYNACIFAYGQVGCLHPSAICPRTKAS